MSSFIVEVKNDDNIERLDLFLSKKISSFSRSFISKMISNEKILVNNIPTNKKYVPKIGDIIFINPEDIQSDYEPIAQNIPLDIVYEDEYLLVIDKPKGMVTHPAPGHYQDTLVNALLYYTKNLSNLNDKFRPGIVHRLDKDTSGLMIVAKNNFVHEKLSSQLKNHKIKREYVGIIHGHMKNPKGIINLPIGRDPRNRQRMSVVYKNSKNAITHYETLKTSDKYSLMKFNLETGRTHQIRVHMSHFGCPLVGDTLYGSKINDDNIQGQCLHSRTIEFVHPINNKLMNFSSELPLYLGQLIYELFLL